MRLRRAPGLYMPRAEGKPAMKQFKTESKKLLDLMINSIYTNKEIFLRELISNASDALDKLSFEGLTDESKRVDEELAIDLSFDKDARTITVADNGIGMTPEFQKILFEPFTRADDKRTTKIQGTGLGMAITKNLVDMMHGTISVKSAKNKGTAFTVELTLQLAGEGDAATAQAAKTQHVDPSHRLRHSRILLVDDNDLNREIAITLLEDEGFTVEYAVNGCEAVEKIMDAPSGHYQLVLMDVQMPVMNGYEATKAIRRLNDPTRAQVPILAMTADAFEEDRQKALRSGMNGHLTKPVEIDKLFKALDEVLG